MSTYLARKIGSQFHGLTTALIHNWNLIFVKFNEYYRYSKKQTLRFSDNYFLTAFLCLNSFPATEFCRDTSNDSRSKLIEI